MKTKTKAKAGAKTAKTVAKNPWIAKLAFRVAKPVAKRKARGHARRVGTAAQTVGTAAQAAGEWVIVIAPIAAEALGTVPRRKRSHTTRRVLLGVMIGATAMYYLRRDAGDQGPKPVP